MSKESAVTSLGVNLAAARIDGDLEHTRFAAAEDLTKGRLIFKFYPPSQKTVGGLLRRSSLRLRRLDKPMDECAQGDPPTFVGHSRLRTAKAEARRAPGLRSRSGRFGGVGKEDASADCAEEIKDTTGISPWRLHCSGDRRSMS